MERRMFRRIVPIQEKDTQYGVKKKKWEKLNSEDNFPSIRNQSII